MGENIEVSGRLLVAIDAPRRAKEKEEYTTSAISQTWIPQIKEVVPQGINEGTHGLG